MTTIAVTDTHVAADSQATCGDEKCIAHPKIVVEDGRIFAVCGSAYLIAPLIQWFSDGAKPFETPKYEDDDGWTLLIIDQTGLHAYSSEAPYRLKMESPFTLGSGFKWAMGALMHGATAEEAVRIACKKDVWSGEPVQVVNIKEALGVEDRPLRLVANPQPR